MSPSGPGRELTAGPDDAGRRLDRVLRIVLKGSSLSEIYAALRQGYIKVNGRKAGPGLRLEEGDRIGLSPSLQTADSRTGEVDSGGGLETIADILVLATADLIFVNKPRGELSQGAEGLEGRIRLALAARSAASLSFVPGPLHRLDRNTTGLLAFPRSAEGARAFTALLRERRVAKRYIALAEGEVAAPETWRDRLARDERTMTSSVSDSGGEASSEMRPLLAQGGLSLVAIEIHSGLTHQIRAQASARGMPLAGDLKYGASPFRGGYILHALSLEFPQPPFPDLPRLVVAPLPESARLRLEELFGRDALRIALDRACSASFWVRN